MRHVDCYPQSAQTSNLGEVQCERFLWLVLLCTVGGANAVAQELTLPSAAMKDEVTVSPVLLHGPRELRERHEREETVNTRQAGIDSI